MFLRLRPSLRRRCRCKKIRPAPCRWKMFPRGRFQSRKIRRAPCPCPIGPSRLSRWSDWGGKRSKKGCAELSGQGGSRECHGENSTGQLPDNLRAVIQGPIAVGQLRLGHWDLVLKPIWKLEGRIIVELTSVVRGRRSEYRILDTILVPSLLAPREDHSSSSELFEDSGSDSGTASGFGSLPNLTRSSAARSLVRLSQPPGVCRLKTWR